MVYRVMMLERILEKQVMDGLEEARSYDAMDHSEPNQAVVNRLIELGAQGRMLDIGTGPGDIPIRIARRLETARIVAVDLSEPMLAIARDKVAAAGFSDRIAVEFADAGRLPFANDSFDVVFSNTIVHHLPDPLPMLREVNRVSRPDGCLLIRDLYRPETTGRIDELVALHADSEPDHQRMLRDSLHAAFTPDELQALADEAGLTGATVVIDTDRHMSLQRPMRQG